MELFLLNLGKLSLLGGAVIALLLALRPLLGKRYHARMFYALWLCLAVLLLLPLDYSVKDAPVQLKRPADYTVFVGSDKTTVVQTERFFAESTTTPVQMRDELAASEPTRYIPVTTVLFYVYLAGAAVFIGVQLVRYGRFRSLVRRWKRDCTADGFSQLLIAEANSIGVRPPRLAVCEAVPTPILLGSVRPTLLLPHEQYAEAKLRFILRHELYHLKRHDMAYKLVLLAANAMHWFNPFLYLMLRTADEDIELSCDSAATSGMERAEKAAYSETLLSAVQERMRAVPATTCFGGTAERLKRRISNVLGADKRRGVGVAVFLVLAAAALGAAVSWGGREQPEQVPAPSATEESEQQLSASEHTAQEDASATEAGTLQRGEFNHIFGLSGYFEIETQEYGFSVCRYYTDSGALLAESYGYENDDHGVDFDKDGVYELVCNCVSGGDGHEEVLLYRLKNGGIELGRLDIEKLHLTDYFNWGVNSASCRYDAQKNEFVLSYTSAKDNAKFNEKICSYGDFTFSRWPEGTYQAPSSAESSPDSRMPDNLENALDYAGYLWFAADGYFSRYADGKGVEQLYRLPLADDGKTPVSASVFVKAESVALTYHVGGATMGHDEMRLFDSATGAQTHEVIGYGVVEILGDTIVKTTGFVPPAPDNLRISQDGGKTWETLGDAKYLYGMGVTVTGSLVSYSENSSPLLTEDYLYITGIDTSAWDSGSAERPETLSLRVDLSTGETVVLEKAGFTA